VTTPARAATIIGEQADCGQTHDNEDDADGDWQLRTPELLEVEIAGDDDVRIVGEAVDRLRLGLDQERVTGSKGKLGEPFVGDPAAASNGEHASVIGVGKAGRLDRLADQVRPAVRTISTSVCSGASESRSASVVTPGTRSIPSMLISVCSAPLVSRTV